MGDLVYEIQDCESADKAHIPVEIVVENLPDNRYVLHSFHLFCLFLHNFFDNGHLDVFDHLNTHLLYHLNRHVRYHLNRHFLHDDHLHRNLFEHDDLLNALDLN